MIFTYLIFLVPFLFSSLAFGAEGETVCMKKTDFSQKKFSFQIKPKRQNCLADEVELKLQREAHGRIVFLPLQAQESGHAED